MERIFHVLHMELFQHNIITSYLVALTLQTCASPWKLFSMNSFLTTFSIFDKFERNMILSAKC